MDNGISSHGKRIMATEVDDLNVGDWIAIHRYYPEENRCELIGNATGVRPEVKYDGIPFKIKAISLPWIATEDPKGMLHTFDVRATRLIKVSEKYAAIVAHANQNGIPAVPVAENRCPFCGKG